MRSFLAIDYPELYQQNLGLANCDIHSYGQMKELCDKFNKIIDTHIKLNRGTEAFSARLEQRATSKLFRHILAQVYSRAVTDPEKLRDYEPFSPSVKLRIGFPIALTSSRRRSTAKHLRI